MVHPVAAILASPDRSLIPPVVLFAPRNPLKATATPGARAPRFILLPTARSKPPAELGLHQAPGDATRNIALNHLDLDEEVSNSSADAGFLKIDLLARLGEPEVAARPACGPENVVHARVARGLISRGLESDNGKFQQDGGDHHHGHRGDYGLHVLQRHRPGSISREGPAVTVTPRWIAILAIGTVLPLSIGAGGCGGDGGGGSRSQQSALTGIGATDLDWRANHRVDYNVPRAYNPDPSLVTPGGDPRSIYDRYYLLRRWDGRVRGYNMRFAPGTSIAEAKADTLAEFPADAKVDWFRTVPVSGIATVCAQMQVSSATLTSELDQGPTAVLVEFSSGAAANSYTPDAVSSASLSQLPTARERPHLSSPPTSPSKASGC